MHRLKKQVPDLQVVQTETECDIILVFCPVVRGPEHDIKAALGKLNNISGTKSAVLVVLHHTFDAEFVVPDSSRAVSRGNTLTVDCLFHEDRGLLQCQTNYESLTRIVTYIKPQIQSKNYIRERMETSQSCVPTGSQSLEQEPVKRKRPLQTEKPTLKYFILLTGRTLNTHETLMGQLEYEIPQLQQVSTVDECDFILAFCPIVSRAGTDIEAGLKKLHQESADKPAVLVVLHRTFDPDCVVPNSSRVVHRENTITVDCLFYEDQGLLHCRKNQESFNRIINYIKPQIQSVQSKEENVETQETPVQAVAAKKSCRYFVIMRGTPDSFMDKLKKMSDLIEVTSEDGCDFILTFCRGVSQDVTDFQRKLKKPESSSGIQHSFIAYIIISFIF
ncbi:uncharacterized protein LOC128512063 isoform X2 [Clarias gariepinus]|uniref:uncharacterized protein LOC128512063 isoform X2 n=1 Tax=Clarias gariepinus TaxID=13013 RepID=UPI00234C70ED|nr:uncharacterized protein LOC128512063 isoform X2 [Clarias gariepinus]